MSNSQSQSIPQGPDAGRTPIFRVKTGCFTCRRRKKKCDELKPVCTGCKRNRRNCHWPASLQVYNKPLPSAQSQLKKPIQRQSSIDDGLGPVPHDTRAGQTDSQDSTASRRRTSEVSEPAKLVAAPELEGSEGSTSPKPRSPGSRIQQTPASPETVLVQPQTESPESAVYSSPDWSGLFSARVDSILDTQFDAIPVEGLDMTTDPNQLSPAPSATTSINITSLYTTIASDPTNTWTCALDGGSLQSQTSAAVETADSGCDDAPQLAAHPPTGQDSVHASDDEDVGAGHLGFALALSPVGVGDRGQESSTPVPAAPCTMPISVPSSMPLMPDRGNDSLKYLSYYLSRTAVSMANGSTGTNPFISQLVPLAFANGLIMDLVLCQAAIQHAIEYPNQLPAANRRYSKSITRFRRAIDRYICHKQDSPFWIILGALILCLTEIAKGDTKGVVFEHIYGVRHLITKLVGSTSSLDDDLRDFVCEYYIYTEAISVTSRDPSMSEATFLSKELEQEGQRLILSRYLGNLCGCWLESILLIPRIFGLVQRSKVRIPGQSFPTINDFIEFSALELQLSMYQPFTPPGDAVSHCGYIFNRAAHVYLLTSFSWPPSGSGQYVEESVDSSVTQAFLHLDEVPADARINTSLCWPLAILGSCVRDEARRDYLRARLSIMFHTIKLGNMLTTLELLEKVWELPEEQQSPWALWRVMQNEQMWTSFI